MKEQILAITGKPGLYRLLSQGKNMLIVENITTHHRMPAYASNKVVALSEVAIYTTGDDMPLFEVMDKVKSATESKPVDIKALGGDAEIREYFGKVFPEYDSERVYTTDIKKFFNWYNTLIRAGITDFAPETKDTEEAAAEEAK